MHAHAVWPHQSLDSSLAPTHLQRGQKGRIRLLTQCVCAAEMLPKILSAVFIEGFLHGNMTSKEALSLGRQVQATLGSSQTSADDRPTDRVMQLPAANLCHR